MKWRFLVPPIVLMVMIGMFGPIFSTRNGGPKAIDWFLHVLMFLETPLNNLGVRDCIRVPVNIGTCVVWGVAIRVALLYLRRKRSPAQITDAPSDETQDNKTDQ